MSESNGQAPVAPAAPVTPAADAGIMRVRVDNRDIDMPVAEVKRYAQMGRAAEVRLQQANEMAQTYRADLDSQARLGNMARGVGVDPMLLKTNPDEFVKQMAARLTQNGQAGHSSQQSQADESDPNTTALRAQIGELTSRLQAVSGQVTSLTDVQRKGQLEQQIDSVLGAYPLFNSNAPYREAAKRVTVATWMADPQRSLTEVAGEVHAMFGEAETAKTNQERDSRVAAEQRNRGIPPGLAQPGMAVPPGPQFSKEDVKAGKNRSWLKSMVGPAWNAVK